jgi:hypothetical protein
MTTVAWRRGFFRLWVVISAFWLIGTAIVAFKDTSIPSLTKDCSMLLDFTVDSTGQKLGAADVMTCKDVWRTVRMEWAEIALGPPIALLILALILGWTARGFRRPSI